ncbi:hypothetical protein EMCRGX_G015197 [Ephydatia muelleri]
MSIAAPVVSILIIITVAAICSVMIRQRNLSKRTNELHLIGYNINEKCDSNVTLTALTSLQVFKSVESQLDSLHEPP